MSLLHSPCGECGGRLSISSGPGRSQKYRGAVREIPEDLAFEVCEACHSAWLSSEQIDRLNDALESQRADVPWPS